jgi:hypothetical protein
MRCWRPRRTSARAAIDEGEQRLEARLAAEAVRAEVRLGRQHCIGRLLEDGELAHEGQQGTGVLGRGEAQRDLGHG